MITIGPEEVRKFLPMNNCIDSMEEMYRIEADYIGKQPARTLTRIDDSSLILTMPALSNKLGKFAVKIITEYKKNPERFGLKIQGGTVFLMNSTTSEALAFIDAAALTAIRTGAVSGLATRLLSRIDSSRVGIIGSGQQARTMLEAICCVREIKQAFVYSRENSHAKEYALEMSRETHTDVTPVAERSEIRAKSPDILIVATNSEVPVLSWTEDLFPGVHINSIGTLPERCELDPDIVSNSVLYADYRDGVLKEAGDVITAIKSGRINEDHIMGDLSDILTGRSRGRTDPEQITLFKSVGFGLQDVYAASKLYDNYSNKTRS